MLTIRKFRVYIGVLLCLIAGFCPMLKVPIKGNWNLYQTDSRLFIITYAIIALCILCFFIRKLSAFRFMVIVLFVWYVVALAAVWFKSSNYFDFKFIDRLLFKTISFQWGWIVLLVGILFLLFSVKRDANSIKFADGGNVNQK